MWAAQNRAARLAPSFKNWDFHAVAEQGQRAVSPGSGPVMRGPLPGEIPLGERGGTGVGHNEINPW